ncbi:MAG: hypothetical protein E6G91_10600 [Alphaproteobacteria bacterium]|nr:MAG: hypothetical protein E6G91_10600 [Alphaproteobacteria bacterium]
MKSAVLEKSVATGVLDIDRLRAFVLVRVACAADGLSKTDLAADLAPLVAHRLAPAQWRTLVERESVALADAGLVSVAGTRLRPSEAGIARAAIFLGLKGALPRSWEEVHEVRLLAKALGLEREPAKRLKTLAAADGLRAALVQRAFGLEIRGVATPSRLRAALAAVALERAFGNQIKGGLAGKLGLSAKAGRLLAAQLAKKPRDFGTDARLVAALAAEHVGAPQAGLATLRLAVLRRYLDGPDKPAARPRSPAKAPLARPRLVETPPAPAEVGRPDLAGFAQEVRRHAATRAEGWPGNRKAYISHVWHLMAEKRPEWGLSEIEFKCMLVEAHRAGSLALANADLKDNSNIAQLQDSAVVYKNAVFHFIRVDG